MAEATNASRSAAPPSSIVTDSPITSTSTTANAAGIEALANATQLLRPSSPRKRPRTPEAAALASGDPQSPLSPKSLVTGVPLPLTAAAEMAEQAKRRKLASVKEATKQSSENPSAKAAAALAGGQGMSRPEDAPATGPSATSDPMVGVAPAPTVPEAKTRSENALTSPRSADGVAAGDHGAGESESVPLMQVASPGAIADEEAPNHGPHENGQVDRLSVNEPASVKALTYPGPLPNAQSDIARRNMSVDSGMPRDDNKSPATNKKHKCPYCATEFTRHHNLKSHLLTHSHEKPYLCQDCDSRFRRLHDLKRHMKLHTGERPHVCPICRRSFARGDALARHNKGQGGCAGRRSSAGSFGDGEDQMEGMMYTTGDASQEPEHMDDDNDGPSPRGSNVPSIRHHDASRQPSRGESQYQRQPSTYPPVAGRAPNAPMGSSLYPPSTPHGGPNGPQSPTSPHGSYPPPNYGPGYSQAPPITESPRPLSPGQHPGDGHHRSPSIPQINANQFARQPTTREPALPPPNHANVPTLPPPSAISLNPQDRYAVNTSQSGATANSYPPPQGGNYGAPGSAGGVHSSASNSLSSHGTGQPGSGERATLPYPNDERLWAFVRSLEAKIDRLENEVGSLRQQLQHQQPYPAPAR